MIFTFEIKFSWYLTSSFLFCFPSISRGVSSWFRGDSIPHPWAFQLDLSGSNSSQLIKILILIAERWLVDELEAKETRGEKISSPRRPI
jgi:hypothetical protein